MFYLSCEAILLRCLRNGTRWQVKVYLVNNLTQVTFHVGHYNRLGKLLSVSLIATVVFNLNMQVERAFASIHFLAVFVRADVLSVNFFRSPAVMFFPVAIFEVVLLVRFLGL